MAVIMTARYARTAKKMPALFLPPYSITATATTLIPRATPLNAVVEPVPNTKRPIGRKHASMIPMKVMVVTTIWLLFIPILEIRQPSASNSVGLTQN